MKALVTAGFKTLHLAGLKRWRQIWKQQLIIAMLPYSVVSLALLNIALKHELAEE